MHHHLRNCAPHSKLRKAATRFEWEGGKFRQENDLWWRPPEVHEMQIMKIKNKYFSFALLGSGKFGKVHGMLLALKSWQRRKRKILMLRTTRHHTCKLMHRPLRLSQQISGAAHAFLLCFSLFGWFSQPKRSLLFHSMVNCKGTVSVCVLNKNTKNIRWTQHVQGKQAAFANNRKFYSLKKLWPSQLWRRKNGAEYRGNINFSWKIFKIVLKRWKSLQRNSISGKEEIVLSKENPEIWVKKENLETKAN